MTLSDCHTLLERLGHVLLYPIRTCLPLFLFATGMHGVVAVLCGCLPELDIHPIVALIFPLWDAYLLCALASLLKKIKMGWIVGVTYGALTMGELFCIFFYDSVINAKILRFVLETTPQESTEFISSVMTNSATWLAIGIVLVISIGGSWLAKRIHGCTQPIRTILGYSVLIFVLVAAGLQTPCFWKIGRCYHAPNCAVMVHPYYCPYLYSPFTRLGFGLAFNHVETQELNLLCEAVQHPTVSNCTHSCPTIVLIIGESYNKYHTPLYNPEALPCTPHLQALRDRGEAICYTDAVTTNNGTSLVLKGMFSTATTLFPCVFREAGYEVYLISNQFADNYTDKWSIIGGTIFNHAALSEAQFSWRNPALYPYDGQLIASVPDSILHTQRPTLYIFHLMGQHVAYRDRYPASYNHFTAEDTHPAFGGHKGKKITAEYANATMYNDQVVDSIWSLFRDRDAVGIYVSDHSDEVYDWRDFYERTDESQINANIAKYQFEIPFLFFLSDTFRMDHPEWTEQIQSCAHRPWINNRLCHTLFSLGGITTTEYDSTRDILSPYYLDTLPRYIGNHVNYDSITCNL